MDRLNVYIEIGGENHLVGDILAHSKENAEFVYADEYIKWQESRPISISLPLEEKSFRNCNCSCNKKKISLIWYLGTLVKMTIK